MTEVVPVYLAGGDLGGGGGEGGGGLGGGEGNRSGGGGEGGGGLTLKTNQSDGAGRLGKLVRLREETPLHFQNSCIWDQRAGRQDASAGAARSWQSMTEGMLSWGRCSLHLHLEGDGGLGGGGDGGGGLVGAAQGKTISEVLC